VLTFDPWNILGQWIPEIVHTIALTLVKFLWLVFCKQILSFHCKLCPRLMFGRINWRIGHTNYQYACNFSFMYHCVCYIYVVVLYVSKNKIGGEKKASTSIICNFYICIVRFKFWVVCNCNYVGLAADK
jgi:hypothetical protein